MPDVLNGYHSGGGGESSLKKNIFKYLHCNTGKNTHTHTQNSIADSSRNSEEQLQTLILKSLKRSNLEIIDDLVVTDQWLRAGFVSPVKTGLVTIATGVRSYKHAGTSCCPLSPTGRESKSYKDSHSNVHSHSPLVPKSPAPTHDHRIAYTIGFFLFVLNRKRHNKFLTKLKKVSLLKSRNTCFFFKQYVHKSF